MAQRNRAFSTAALNLTHPNAAGIDIGSASHFVLLREWFWATRPQAVPKRKWVRLDIPWKAMVFQTTQEPY